MEKSTYRKTLDVQKQGVQFRVGANQYEAKSRQIILNITDGGKPFVFSSSLTAVLYAEKPDGTVLYNSCSVEGNKVTYTFTQQTLASAGDVRARLQIISNDESLESGDNIQILYSPEFVIQVSEISDYGDAIESTDEYTALTEQTASALAAATAANTAASSASAAASNISASVTQTQTGATIIVTDSDGTQSSADIFNGQNGADGADGRTFTVDGVTIDGTNDVLSIKNGSITPEMLKNGFEQSGFMTSLMSLMRFNLTDGAEYDISNYSQGTYIFTGGYGDITNGMSGNEKATLRVWCGNILQIGANYATLITRDDVIRFEYKKADWGNVRKLSSVATSYTMGNTMQAPGNVLDIKDGAVSVSKIASSVIPTLTGRKPLDLSESDNNNPIRISDIIADTGVGVYDVVSGGTLYSDNWQLRAGHFSSKKYINTGAIVSIGTYYTAIFGVDGMQYYFDNAANEIKDWGSYDGSVVNIYDLEYYANEFLQSYLSKTEASSIYQPKNQYIQNTALALADWEEEQNPAYAEYTYVAEIAINGVTSSNFVEVIFDVETATSGMIAPIVESVNGGIKIYAKEAVAVVIPTIKVEA